MKKSFDYAKYAVDEIIGYGFKNNLGLRNTRAVGIIPEKTFKGDLDFHPFKQMLYLHGLKSFIVKGKPKRGIYNVDLRYLLIIYLFFIILKKRYCLIIFLNLWLFVIMIQFFLRLLKF